MSSSDPDLKAKHPIVLMHGAMGFVRLGLPGLRLDYFHRVRGMLESHGNRVFVWKAPNLASVEQRARVILDHLRAHEAEGPFNLVAHSMGGLDARCVISTLGGADLVASLTTIGAPHHGTEAAEWRNRVLRRLGLAGLLRSRESGRDLHLEVFTREWSARFNESNPDAPHVRYRCWAGDAPTLKMAPVLQPFAAIIRRREGANDGLVSVKAASHSDAHPACVIPADHFAQLGWKLGLNRFDSFDHLAFHRGILREAVEAGL